MGVGLSGGKAIDKAFGESPKSADGPISAEEAALAAAEDDSWADDLSAAMSAAAPSERPFGA